MHRAKAFLDNLGEEILQGMERMDKKITPAQLTTLASMAEDYNELCKFVKHHSEHKMGKMMDKDEYHADTSRPAMPTR